MFYKLTNCPGGAQYIKILIFSLLWFRLFGLWMMVARNCITYNDIEYLCLILKNCPAQYNLKCSIHSSGGNKGFIIYKSCR